MILVKIPRAIGKAGDITGGSATGHRVIRGTATRPIRLSFLKLMVLFIWKEAEEG